MSVPVEKRGHGELEVNMKARALAVYTFTILKNEKYFPQDQAVFIHKLQSCVLKINMLCWDANNIKVDNNELRYQRRLDLQDQAAELCNEFHCLIEIAKPLFHLKNKRVQYWTKLTTDLRALIRAWRDKDVIRLKPQG